MKSQNQMTREECKMAFPKAKWFNPPESPTQKAEIPEELLQDYANQAITLRGWTFIRFHTKLLGWIKRNSSVPEWVRKCFFSQVAGKLPDNLIMVQFAPSTFLAIKLELKTQDKKGRSVGRTHGLQKHYAELEDWYIARSPEQINVVLDKTEALVEAIKKMVDKDKTQTKEAKVAIKYQTPREVLTSFAQDPDDLPPFDPIQMIGELEDTKIAIQSNFNEVALSNIDEMIAILRAIKK